MSDVLARAAEVLVWHQRTGPATCACGPMPLGSSHPAHQAQMLADAGLLAGSACLQRPTTHETLDSLTARLVAARAATDGYRTETERLRELLDEAHAKIERMEEL